MFVMHWDMFTPPMVDGYSTRALKHSMLLHTAFAHMHVILSEAFVTVTYRGIDGV